MECRKCKSKNLGVRQNAKNPNHTDLYCKDCGAWQKFATTDEIRLYNKDDGWISVAEHKPKCEEEVFVRVKHGQRYVTTTAIYEDGTMFTGKSKWTWEDIDFDYDEENDEYLIPKSWWEYRHYNPDDVYNNIIDGEVTHWMPLPEPPKGE